MLGERDRLTLLDALLLGERLLLGDSDLLALLETLGDALGDTLGERLRYRGVYVYSLELPSLCDPAVATFLALNMISIFSSPLFS